MSKISEARNRFIQEIKDCPACRKAEMARATNDFTTTTQAVCSYHYDKGLVTK